MWESRSEEIKEKDYRIEQLKEKVVLAEERLKYHVKHPFQNFICYIAWKFGKEIELH
jgi:hypothetical protein